MMRRSLFTSLALCALALWVGSAPALAQLELPKKRAAGREADERAPRGNVAPYIECTVCSERNYTAQRQPDEHGMQQVYCPVCQRVTLHRDPASERGKSRGQLALPRHVAAKPSAEPAAEPAPASAGAPIDPSAAELTDAGRAASAVLEEVGRLETLDPRVGAQAVAHLVGLREPGRIAARRGLASDHVPTLLVCARTLLQDGTPPDMEAVVRRLRGRLPNAAGGALVDLLVEEDPVRASPALLCGLLDHGQAGVRAAAARHVRSLSGPALVPNLAALLDSKRSDTRLIAVEMLASIDDPEAVDALIAHLADPTAKVASRIVGALAVEEDPRVAPELLGIAFGERWILRREGYAILALVEREDVRLEPLFDASHVELLLAGAASKDPFVSGVSAAALAGIGFRSPDPASTPWLDRIVPDRLVYAVSGKEYHNDTSSLAEPVRRRLALITGEAFGTDGPRWVEWWLTAREGFVADRAWIAVGEGGAASIELDCKSGGAGAAPFALVGPAKADAAAPRLGETVLLSEAEAGDVTRLLAREGVFGPERLPGLRGARGPDERSVAVRVGGRGKEFVFGAGASEPWFERVIAMAASLRDRNVWQRYPPPGEPPAAFWRRESTWWSGDASDLERDIRLKTLVLASLAGQPVAQRDAGVAELARVYEHPEVPDADDYAALVALLGEERFIAGRARTLVALVLRAAREPDGDAVTRARADELVALLHDKFGPAATEDLVAVYRAAGDEFARAMVTSERPLLRAVAAAALADHPSEEDVAALMRLLGDPVAEVETAAVVALGADRVEAARTELLLRARVGRPLVRKAALRAVGKLGGEYALEALLLGLTDADAEIRVAAAQGLAALGDPRAAPHLARLLGEPAAKDGAADAGDTAVRDAARDGLEQLGTAARTELLRVLHSPENPGRREAAILLARQREPAVVPALIGFLTQAADDARIAWELCVLTCVDHREAEAPAQSWWAWWDSVVHDDALAWFRAALEREGIGAPPPDAFGQGASLETARFLLTAIADGPPYLAERARRELEIVLGRRIPELPPKGAERDAWLGVARSWIDQELGQ